MKNTKHNLIGSWTGASYDASGSLRVVPAGQMTAVSRQDMVKI